ncbi:MAG TPA: helix-turn-helix transcriptional regulator [Saprospiraceae bacterium]|nr:helix-turn-helix transcriptional regulator [Saprospiraceae bacterium]
MADKAFITPNVLKWARESARMTEETAAAKIPKLTVEKLKEWEEGTSQPTIRQAQILAKAYKRPFALFFLPNANVLIQRITFQKTENIKILHHT